MSKISRTLLAGLLATLFTGSASAYTLTVVNGTGEDIAFDPGGYGVAGGSMIQGKIKHIFGDKVHNVDKRGNTTYYQNAGAVPNSEFGQYNKPIIQPGHTAVFEFTDLDVGICFDYASQKVGTPSGNYAMIPREVKYADNATINTLISQASSLSGGIKKVGEGIGKAESSGAQVAGGVIEGLGDLWEKGVNFATGTGCGNRSMVIVQDKDNPNNPIGIFVSKG